MKRGCVVSMFLLLFMPVGSAQYVIDALPRWMFSMHGEYMVPQGAIDPFLSPGGWGYRIEGQYRLHYNQPFVAGLYFNEASISRYSKTYMDSGVDIREKASTRRFEYGLTAGFYPEVNWILQPYVQGRFGRALYKTSSVLTDRDTGENIDRIKEYAEHVLAYGLDFGIHIVPDIWYVRGDVRVGIIANPSVTFLSLNEALKDMVTYPVEAFEQHTSSGLWVKVSAGVSYLF